MQRYFAMYSLSYLHRSKKSVKFLSHLMHEIGVWDIQEVYMAYHVNVMTCKHHYFHLCIFSLFSIFSVNFADCCVCIFCDLSPLCFLCLFCPPLHFYILCLFCLLCPFIFFCLLFKFCLFYFTSILNNICIFSAFCVSSILSFVVYLIFLRFLIYRLNISTFYILSSMSVVSMDF